MYSICRDEVRNLESQISLYGEELNLSALKYNEASQVITSLEGENKSLSKENQKLARKIRRNKFFTGLVAGVGVAGWLLVLL